MSVIQHRLCKGLGVFAILAGTLLLATTRPQRHESQRSPLPLVTLWAWERPEDLRFVNPTNVGVAFLAGTISLGGDGVIVRPRFQPLRVPDGTHLEAVVRIETSRTNPPFLSAEQRTQTVAAISRLGRLEGIRGVQVDFDATVSERAFYRELLIDLRRELRKDRSLSVTALASWCLGDPWLERLPANTIDEAIPMLFRMGVDEANIARDLAAGGDFRSPICRNSTGISIDERAWLPKSRRLYVFNPRPWSKAEANIFLREKQP